MKKLSLLITLLISIIILVSCGGEKSNSSNTSTAKPSETSSTIRPSETSSTTKTSVTTTETAEEKAIKAFNSIINHDYNSFDVVVITTKDDLKLTSTYNVVKKGNSFEITYSIESYNKFDISSESIPEEMISTKTGTYTTTNNQFSLDKFIFDKNKYSSYEFKTNSLIVEIANAKSYLGVDYDCNNFEMVLSYTTILNNIKISYYLSDQTYCQTIYKNFA